MLAAPRIILRTIMQMINPFLKTANSSSVKAEDGISNRRVQSVNGMDVSLKSTFLSLHKSSSVFVERELSGMFSRMVEAKDCPINKWSEEAIAR